MVFFFFFVLAHGRVFRPLWASIFYEGLSWPSPFGPAYGCSNPFHTDLSLAKEKGPKERPPYRVGLRLLCALQRRAGAAELAIAQTVLALFRSKPAVLDNTKGVVRSKTRSKPRWQPIRYVIHPRHYSVIPAQAGIQSL